MVSLTNLYIALLHLVNILCKFHYNVFSSITNLFIMWMELMFPRSLARSFVTNDNKIFYYNPKLKISSWEHPTDEFYRKLIKEEKNRIKNGTPTNPILDFKMWPVAASFDVPSRFPEPYKRMSSLHYFTS